MERTQGGWNAGLSTWRVSDWAPAVLLIGASVAVSMSTIAGTTPTVDRERIAFVHAYEDELLELIELRRLGHLHRLNPALAAKFPAEETAAKTMLPVEPIRRFGELVRALDVSQLYVNGSEVIVHRHDGSSIRQGPLVNALPAARSGGFLVHAWALAHARDLVYVHVHGAREDFAITERGW